jgi:hypothetical protein
MIVLKTPATLNDIREVVREIVERVTLYEAHSARVD